MQHDTMTEIINTLSELRRIHQLNLELLEQLSVSCSWLMEHNISIPNVNTLCSLLSKVKSLVDEIQSDEPKILQYQKLADEKKQHPETDGEVTEPYFLSIFTAISSFEDLVKFPVRRAR